MDVPQQAWTFGDSQNLFLLPWIQSRFLGVYPTALVTVLTVTAERSFTSTPPYVFVMHTGQLTLCVHTCDKRAELQKLGTSRPPISRAIMGHLLVLGSRLRAASKCKDCWLVPVAVVPTSTNTSFTKTLQYGIMQLALHYTLL